MDVSNEGRVSFQDVINSRIPSEFKLSPNNYSKKNKRLIIKIEKLCIFLKIEYECLNTQSCYASKKDAQEILHNITPKLVDKKLYSKEELLRLLAGLLKLQKKEFNMAHTINARISPDITKIYSLKIKSSKKETTKYSLVYDINRIDMVKFNYSDLNLTNLKYMNEHDFPLKIVLEHFKKRHELGLLANRKIIDSIIFDLSKKRFYSINYSCTVTPDTNKLKSCKKLIYPAEWRCFDKFTF